MGCFVNVVVVVSLMLTTVHGQLLWEVIANSSKTTPSVRRDSGLGYDSVRNRLILFGGRTNTNKANIVLADTWIFELSTRMST